MPQCSNSQNSIYYSNWLNMSNHEQESWFWGALMCGSTKSTNSWMSSAPWWENEGNYTIFHRTHMTDECWEEEKKAPTLPVKTMATAWMLQPETFQANQRGGLIATPQGKQKRGDTRVEVGAAAIKRLPHKASMENMCVIPTGDGSIEAQQLLFYTKWHTISVPSLQL